MLVINSQLSIPEAELAWSFARSAGPGGQNVNKVASKAVLRWDLAGNTSLPEPVKDRVRALERHRITVEGDLVLSSQRFRDQLRNRQDCLDKLRAIVQLAAQMPKKRKATRASRSSHERRLTTKRHRSATKTGRRQINDD